MLIILVDTGIMKKKDLILPLKDGHLIGEIEI